MNKIDIRSATLHARLLATHLHEHTVANATLENVDWNDTSFRVDILETIAELRAVLTDIELKLPPF